MRTFDMLRTVYKVGDFVSWQRAGTLVLSASFQRRPVWKPLAKSFLIDTILRGLPIPIIFLREQKTELATLEPRREVVDGQQRIRTVLSYVAPDLLDDFKPSRDEFTISKVHSKEFANRNFSELPPEAQNQILNYQFSVHVLPAEVDDRQVLQIFARMNATGVKLNQQEIRNATFFGEFKTSMYEIASEQLPRWRKWRVFTEYDIARMGEVELTSEFAMLMLKGLTKKAQSAIDTFYRERESLYPERDEVTRRFRIIMDTIDDSLGAELRSLPFRKKTLFYSLFAFLYDVRFGIGSPMTTTRPGRLPAGAVQRVKIAGQALADGAAPEIVLNAVDRRTTDLGSRLTLLKYLRGQALDG